MVEVMCPEAKECWQLGEAEEARNAFSLELLEGTSSANNWILAQ